MTAAPRPAALLWDMDGTLVDTEPYWIEAEFAVVQAHGGRWSLEQAHALVGSDLLRAAAIIAEQGPVPLTPQEIVEALLAQVITRVQEHTPWLDGARELLAEARAHGIPCALVTMSWASLAHAVADQLPAGTLDAVITGDAVTRGKPDPEAYLLAAERLGVPATDCIALEDSPTGVAAAVGAGCATLAVPRVAPVPPGEGYVVRENGVQGLSLAGLCELLGPVRSARKPMAM